MSTDTLIREVDDELRRDRLRKLWRQGGPWVIGAAVAVVLGVAGYEGWMWWQKSQSSAASDKFYTAAALADGTDVAAAQKALDDVIASSSGAYPTLAKFRQAALLAKSGKLDEAVAAYDALSTSESNTHFRNLALLLAANLLSAKGDVPTVEQRIQGLVQPTSPLRNAAREVLGLTQYKAGKLDDAMTTFQAILADPAAGSDIRNRIQIYSIQLLGEGAKLPLASREPAPADVSSSAPADTASSAASTGVDASTELDVAPPVVDASVASSAPVSSAASSAEASSAAQ